MSDSPVELLRLFDMPPVQVQQKSADGRSWVWVEDPSMPMSHGEIQEALGWYHRGGVMGQWVGFSELNTADLGRSGYSAVQRMDFWALNRWSETYWHGFPGSGKNGDLLAVAYEVKASRADFLRELRSPEKREAAMEWSNLFYFACAPGVVADASEIPDGCGLVVIGREARKWTGREYRFQWVVKPSWREKRQPSWAFLRTLSDRMDARINAVSRGERKSDDEQASELVPA